MADSVNKKSESPGKITSVESLAEVTQSQLRTPSQLSLPTLSVLQTDLLGDLEAYRPKQIVHKEPPPKELVGSVPLGKHSGQDQDWNLAYDLVLRYSEFPISNIRFQAYISGCWQFGAVASISNRPVSVLVSPQAFGAIQMQVWGKFKSQLDDWPSELFPGIVHSGLLLGGYPIIVYEIVSGPLLLDCHAGVHLPGCRLDQQGLHSREWLRMLLQVAQSLFQLHQRRAALGRLHWHALRIDRSDAKVKLMHWQLSKWLFNSTAQTSEDILAEQQRDREQFGRFLFLMICPQTCDSSTWETDLDQPTAEIASRLPIVPHALKPLSNIILKCIRAPGSQGYSKTESLVEELSRAMSMIIDSIEKPSRN